MFVEIFLLKYLWPVDLFRVGGLHGVTITSVGKQIMYLVIVNLY